MKITRNLNGNPGKSQTPKLYPLPRIIKNLKESGNFNGEFLYNFRYWCSIRNKTSGIEHFISNPSSAPFMRDSTIDKLQDELKELVDNLINSDNQLKKERDEYIEKEKARRKAEEDAWRAKRDEEDRKKHVAFLDKMLLTSKEYKESYSKFLNFVADKKGDLWEPIRSKVSEFPRTSSDEFETNKVYVTINGGIPTVRDASGNAYTYYTIGTLVRLIDKSSREVAVMGPTFYVTSDASFGNRGSTFDTGFSKEVGKMDKSGDNYTELNDFIEVMLNK